MLAACRKERRWQGEDGNRKSPLYCMMHGNCMAFCVEVLGQQKRYGGSSCSRSTPNILHILPRHQYHSSRQSRYLGFYLNILSLVENHYPACAEHFRSNDCVQFESRTSGGISEATSTTPNPEVTNDAIGLLGPSKAHELFHEHYPFIEWYRLPHLLW